MLHTYNCTCNKSLKRRNETFIWWSWSAIRKIVTVLSFWQLHSGNCIVISKYKNVNSFLFWIVSGNQHNSIELFIIIIKGCTITCRCLIPSYEQISAIQSRANHVLLAYDNHKNILQRIENEYKHSLPTSKFVSTTSSNTSVFVQVKSGYFMT